MRDNFTEKTKLELAKRVAFKCSYPDCNVILVGPSSKSSSDSINLGEAAHIFAASEKEPRPNPNMTSEERRSIDNGIWMCRHHARLIDNDYTEYSATTLKQWKKNAAYKQLQEPLAKTTKQTSTLIGLGSNILFKGIWKSVKNNTWRFSVGDFIVGSINELKEFSVEEAKNSLNNYIIIESQGDGRKLEDVFGWEYLDEELVVEVNVKKKLPRESPYELGGDIALGEDGDISFLNGDFALVSGIENAKQIIKKTLSIGFGELKYAPTIGSYFSKYF